METLIQTSGDVTEHHVDCVRCGYNLHGLSLHDEAACPECGEPVRNAFAKDRLIFAEPTWLANRVAGLVWLCVGCAVYLFLYLGRLAVDLLVVDPRVLEMTALLPHAVLSFGLWRLTKHKAAEPDTLWYEQLIRLGLVGYWGGLLMSQVFEALGQLRPASMIHFICDQVLWIGLALVTLQYLAHLAKRIPDKVLERFCRITLKVMFWSYLFIALVVLQLQALLGAGVFELPIWVTKSLMIVDPTMLTLMFVIWLLALGWWFHHSLTRCGMLRA